MGRDEDSVQNMLDRESIRDLAQRYILALDSKDFDGVASLFSSASDFGRSGHGPAGARAFYRRTMRHFVASMHMIGNHVINLESRDAANGVVYCRSYQYREGGNWWEIAFAYHDDYVRESDTWRFLIRVPRYWYRNEITPSGRSERIVLDSAAEDPHTAGQRPSFEYGQRIAGAGEFHEALPTWYPFWLADTE